MTKAEVGKLRTRCVRMFEPAFAGFELGSPQARIYHSLQCENKNLCFFFGFSFLHLTNAYGLVGC